MDDTIANLAAARAKSISTGGVLYRAAKESKGQGTFGWGDTPAQHLEITAYLLEKEPRDKKFISVAI